MTLTLIVGVVLFLSIIYLIYKTTVKEYHAEYGERERKVWGGGVYYWQWAVIFSGGISFFILYLLVSANVLST